MGFYRLFIFNDLQLVFIFCGSGGEVEWYLY